MRKFLFLSVVAILSVGPAFSLTITQPDAVFKDSLKEVQLFTNDYPLSVGDFNGDGRGDIAVGRYPDKQFVVDILAGDRWSGNLGFDTFRIFRVIVPLTGFSLPRCDLADLNGDGRLDLLIQSQSGQAKVWVFFGRAGEGEEVDLNSQQADLEIAVPQFVSDMDSGDVDGDGRTDVLMGFGGVGSNRGVCYLIRGKVSFPSSMTLGDPEVGPIFWGDSNLRGGFGSYVSVSDVDGDKRDDLIISAPNMEANQPTSGATHFFFSSSSNTWGTWDITSVPSPLTLQSSSVCFSPHIVRSKDFDKDGRSDVLIWGVGDSSLVWVSGVDLFPGIIAMVNAPPFRHVGQLYPAATGDFDGDGRADLFCYIPGPSNNAVRAWLSTEDASPLSSSNTFVSIDAYGDVLGDVDGDGVLDLVGVTHHTVFRNVTEEMFVTYGFHPFWNPSFIVRERRADSNRVSLDFFPDGDAVDVRIEGDVVDPVPGSWVPYTPSLSVVLSPQAGEKSILVTYREKGGRESAMLRRAIELQPASGHIGAWSNDVGRGRPGVWEVSTPGGFFRVTVYTVDGERVRVLDSGDRPEGVYEVSWDGLTVTGRPASAGVYILVVEVGSEVKRQRFLIRP